MVVGVICMGGSSPAGESGWGWKICWKCQISKKICIHFADWCWKCRPSGRICRKTATPKVYKFSVQAKRKVKNFLVLLADGRIYRKLPTPKISGGDLLLAIALSMWYRKYGNGVRFSDFVPRKVIFLNFFSLNRLIEIPYCSIRMTAYEKTYLAPVEILKIRRHWCEQTSEKLLVSQIIGYSLRNPWKSGEFVLVSYYVKFTIFNLVSRIPRTPYEKIVRNCL